MVEQEYTLEEISYSRKEDRRIMESVLNNWFMDPKLLNFISPDFNYPFRFKKWISKYYRKDITNITTIILKHNDWIIGHASIHIDGMNGRVFHLFIDEPHRNNGLGIKLIQGIENYGIKSGVQSIQIYIQKKNIIGYRLFQRLGYIDQKEPNSNLIRMYKNVNN
jgi:GNAT superfamily N-acetyltransferase